MLLEMEGSTTYHVFCSWKWLKCELPSGTVRNRMHIISLYKTTSNPPLLWLLMDCLPLLSSIWFVFCCIVVKKYSKRLIYNVKNEVQRTRLIIIITKLSINSQPVSPMLAAPAPQPLLLGPGELVKSSGKYPAPTRVVGKNYCKDEVVIRNADSGKGKNTNTR